MHNHVANRGRKALLKQIFSVFLIFTLYFNSFNNAYASTVGGWSIGGLVADGASAIVNGSKQVIIDGKNYIKKGTAKITPTASQVSKVLARGAAGYALSVAVEQLLGAVDWVLDPENNRIKYFTPPTDPNNPAIQYLWSDGRNKFATAKEALESSCRGYRGSSYVGISNITIGTDRADAICLSSDGLSNVGSVVTRVNNPAYDPNAEREEKTLPLDVVAQKVISNAEGGDSAAQAATTAAAADIVAEAEQDEAKARPIVQQLEASASTENSDSAAQDAANEATGQSQPNTANPQATDIKLNFPVFCGWAPLVCQAAQTVISFPQTLTNWWNTATTSISGAWTWTKTKYEAAVTSITDFFKNEPNPDSDNSLPVQDIPLPELNTGTFKATAGCPAPIPINITIGTKGTGSISYEPICQFASKWSFVAPLIGFLSAAMILVGVGRKGEDSEI